MSKRASKTSTSPGKTMFVKEFLIDNGEGNVSAVNEAWTEAGFEGSISATLVNKLRSKLGLVGNLRRSTKTSKAAPTAKPVARKAETPRATATPVVKGTMGVNEARGRYRSPDFQGHGDWRSHRDRECIAASQAIALCECQLRLIHHS